MLPSINYTNDYREGMMVLMIRRTEQEVAVMEALSVMYLPTTRTTLAEVLNEMGVRSATGNVFAAKDITPKTDATTDKDKA